MGRVTAREVILDFFQDPIKVSLLFAARLQDAGVSSEVPLATRWGAMYFLLEDVLEIDSASNKVENLSVTRRQRRERFGMKGAHTVSLSLQLNSR